VYIGIIPSNHKGNDRIAFKGLELVCRYAVNSFRACESISHLWRQYKEDVPAHKSAFIFFMGVVYRGSLYFKGPRPKITP